MSTEYWKEAQRQLEICNACRYCEGFCSVFPSISRNQTFTEGTIYQLANLCHDCRGCYYSCQYTEPHEFNLNIPEVMSEVRYETWKMHSWPRGFSTVYDRSGVLVAGILTLSIALIFYFSQYLRPESGDGFYAFLSHGMMLAIFIPSFIGPLVIVYLSIQKYWKAIGGGKVHMMDIYSTLKSIAEMRNLAGGHGDGCNFENKDKYTNTRKWFHQATLLGFLMCFASTCSGTVLHYGFGLEAPYDLFSLPKLFGVPGGFILCLGTGGLAWLKFKADAQLGRKSAWGGEMAFVLLLFFVSASGLLLYAFTNSSAVGILLPIHLGSVLCFFLLIPYTKMVHGFYRMAALIKDCSEIRQTTN